MESGWRQDGVRMASGWRQDASGLPSGCRHDDGWFGVRMASEKYLSFVTQWWYCPCSLIATQQQLCVSVMGETVSHTPCSFLDVVSLLDTALQLHDIKCFKAAASQFIMCGEMLFTLLRRFLATESCEEKVCIGGQVWARCVQVCQRALCVLFGCQRAVCVLVVCQRTLFVSFVCQCAVCVSFVSQRCLCVISVSARCVCASFGCQRAVCVWMVSRCCPDGVKMTSGWRQDEVRNVSWMRQEASW